jgi:hypothetical protein
VGKRANRDDRWKETDDIVKGFWAWMVVIVMALILTHAIAFAVGFSKGEADCKRIMPRLGEMQNKAKVMMNVAVVKQAQATETIQNCLEIGMVEARKEGLIDGN